MKKTSGILFFAMFFFLAVAWEAQVWAQSSGDGALLEGVLESLGEDGGGDSSGEGSLLEGIFESMEKAQAEAEAKKKREKAEAEAKKRREKAEAEARERREKAERRERERRRAAEEREREEQNRRRLARTFYRAFELAEDVGDVYVENKRIEVEARRAIAAENERRRAAAEAETRRLQAEADAAAERMRREREEAAERARRQAEAVRQEAARSSSSAASRGSHVSGGDAGSGGSSGDSEDSEVLGILDQALSSGDSDEGSGGLRAEERRREAEREKQRIAKAEAEKAAKKEAERAKAEKLRKEKEAEARVKEEAEAAEKERIKREKEKKIPFYSAVAGSYDKGHRSPVYGYASGHRSEDEARASALEKCRKAGGDNCGITANLMDHIHNGCVALAYWPDKEEKYREGRSNVEAGVGVSLRQAEASAIDACRIWNFQAKRGECKIVFSRCYCMRSGCEPRWSHNSPDIYVPRCFQEGKSCKE